MISLEAILSAALFGLDGSGTATASAAGQYRASWVRRGCHSFSGSDGVDLRR